MSKSGSESVHSKKSIKLEQDNCKVYVSNIYKDVEQSQLRAEFQKFGEIKYFVLKKKQNEVTYSFIQYYKPESAKEVILKMNRSNFYNRALNVQYGRGGKNQQRHYEQVSANLRPSLLYQRNRSNPYRKYDDYSRSGEDDRNYREKRSSKSYSPVEKHQGRKYLRRESSPRYSEYKNQRFKKDYDQSRRSQREYHKQTFASKRNEYVNSSRDYKKPSKYQEPKKYPENNYENERKYLKDFSELKREKYISQKQRDSEYHRRKQDQYPRYPEQYVRDRSRYETYEKQIYPPNRYSRDEKRGSVKKVYNLKDSQLSPNQRSKGNLYRSDRYRRSRSRQKSYEKREPYRREKLYPDSYQRTHEDRSQRDSRKTLNSYSPDRNYERKNNYNNQVSFRFQTNLNEDKFLSRDSYQRKKSTQNRNSKKTVSSPNQKENNDSKMKFSSDRSSLSKQHVHKGHPEKRF